MYYKSITNKINITPKLARQSICLNNFYTVRVAI